MCLCEHLAECVVVHVQVRCRGHVGDGTLGVVQLVEGQAVGLITCEGGVYVVDVVSPVGGVRQVYPGDHDELEVELEMQDGEVGKGNEEEVEVKEVEREKRSDTRVKHVDDTRRHSNLSQSVRQQSDYK